jgi:hypothetical protein
MGGRRRVSPSQAFGVRVQESVSEFLLFRRNKPKDFPLPKLQKSNHDESAHRDSAREPGGG